MADCLISGTGCAVRDPGSTQVIVPQSTVVPANGGRIVTAAIINYSSDIYLLPNTLYKIWIEVDDIDKNLENNKFETAVLHGHEVIDKASPP